MNDTNDYMAHAAAGTATGRARQAAQTAPGAASHLVHGASWTAFEPRESATAAAQQNMSIGLQNGDIRTKVTRTARRHPTRTVLIAISTVTAATVGGAIGSART